MPQMVPINVFPFMAFDAESLERLSRYDGPGIFLVVAPGPPVGWAHVGVAHGSLRDEIRALAAAPGKLQEIIARGATFAPVIVRDLAAREAALRFLVHELRPAIQESTRPPSDEHQCVLMFHGPEHQHPPYRPSASAAPAAKVQAA